MLRQGTECHIVNTAFAAGLDARPWLGMYSASKYAVVAISEVLQQELAMTGAKIGVSVLCPAIVIRVSARPSATGRPPSATTPAPRPAPSTGVRRSLPRYARLRDPTASRRGRRCGCDSQRLSRYPHERGHRGESACEVRSHDYRRSRRDGRQGAGVKTVGNVHVVEATQDHAPFLAWVCLTAFRSHLEAGFWDFMLDGDEVYKLGYLEALVQTEQRHWSHYSTFLVAEVNGRAAAALGGYFAEELGGPTLRLAGEEANLATGRSDREAAAGFERASSIMMVLPEHIHRAWIVENVATAPEFRRRGLCEALVEGILDRGRARGAVVSDISVFIGNDSAQRAYEKCGFEPVGERRNPDFEEVYGTPGTRTLRRLI